MIKPTKNNKSGNKPLTTKAFLRITGMAILVILLLIAIAGRVWHYFQYHLTK